jgi:hypothetical protein
VCLADEEAALLRDLPEQLRSVIDSARSLVRGNADPVVERLFPRAYLDPTEEASEDEWQRLMHDELLREKLAHVDAFAAGLDRAAERDGWIEVELSAEEASAWLGALNDARLALGVRLGVTEDMDLEALNPASADDVPLVIYRWLTWAQGDLIETLMG